MKKNLQTKKQLTITLILLMSVIVLSGLVGYNLGLYRAHNDTPKQNTPGFITAEAARDQVNNFYQQYLHSKGQDPEKWRNILVSNYGSKNLVFYKIYYQHGFDPITCSSTMPISVTATNIQPGPGATAKAEAIYTDGSTAIIDVTLVINTEGFKMDTITCPGDKGNLTPNP